MDDVEIVARALAQQSGVNPDKSLWPYGPTKTWMNFQTEAQAAITALRQAGWCKVEEAAKVADETSEMYDRHIRDGNDMVNGTGANVANDIAAAIRALAQKIPPPDSGPTG